MTLRRSAWLSQMFWKSETFIASVYLTCIFQSRKEVKGVERRFILPGRQVHGRAVANWLNNGPTVGVVAKVWKQGDQNASFESSTRSWGLSEFRGWHDHRKILIRRSLHDKPSVKDEELNRNGYERLSYNSASRLIHCYTLLILPFAYMKFPPSLWSQLICIIRHYRKGWEE